MANNISYATVMDVTSSWDTLKMVKDYKVKSGDLIFSRVLELEPEARTLFNFSAKEDVRSNPKFAFHADQMVSMIDTAVAFLGPDLEPLEEDLHALGRRHIRYGVPAKFLPTMEKAVVYTMEELLGDKFTRTMRNSWQVVIYFMVQAMVAGMEEGK
jgi:hemoglobin-like flavoprotein